MSRILFIGGKLDGIWIDILDTQTHLKLEIPGAIISEVARRIESQYYERVHLSSASGTVYSIFILTGTTSDQMMAMLLENYRPKEATTLGEARFVGFVQE